MIPAVALLDANVLYPSLLRDLLLQLSYAGLFQARWSAEITDEWQRNLLRNRPELAGRIAATERLMLQAIPDALVTGYERRIAMLSLPDPDDRHVLAAAISAVAGVIVTFNLKDFPPASLAPHRVAAVHPDRFLNMLALELPGPFFSSVRECVARLTHPPVSGAGYLRMMSKLGLTETVTRLASAPELWLGNCP